ncbi:uncharacterized protein N7446_008607 [Penicillium canescens]|uniref:Uncharacterized protein n=1 Tax=Penicillium canescens TaxID=5083 RepID=A0AAD6IP84_PENCN|nr:uncharacterized protein N7446_008607 [Penicillium canescens]KAJ6057711.1 hypothetical protein N7460_000985 [Penicillium canescens]KAJ6059024.1 hypothetical protein N7446_008607 [Penicillium canescens]
MDVEELEVYLVVDKNLVASVQTNFVPEAVLGSTKAPKRDQPLTMSPNPRVKRKLHSMTLRSESRRASEDAPVSSSSSLSSPSSSLIADGRPITHDNPSLTEGPLFSTTDNERLPGAFNPSPSMNYASPFQFPFTLASTGNRVWATRRPASYDFPIYEEPCERRSPSPVHEDEYLGFSPQDEDKENVFSTRSDLSSSDDEPQQSPTLNQTATSHRDAFGIPLAHQISDFIESNDDNLDANVLARPERQVLRPIWVPEPEEPEEIAELYDDSITRTQIREIEEVEALYQRGDRNRARNNRHAAFRHGTPVQARTNFNTDIRRILEPQRREAHRSSLDEDEEEH